MSKMDKSTADLILFNASMITLSPEYPKAQMVATKDGRILSVSGNEAIRELRGTGTEVIDCHGLTVLPGFTDAHGHLIALAKSLLTPNLDKTTVGSIADIQNIIEEIARRTPAGSWIQATSYDEFYLAEKRHPTRWDLDKATTTHPVKLTHRSGRAHVLNSLALTLIGISRETPEPPGGMIERDLTTGEPNGLLYGMSEYLDRVLSPLEDGEIDDGIRQVSQQLLSKGITSIHEASPHNDIQRWQDLQRWKAEGYFRPRVNMMLGIDAFQQYRQRNLISGSGDDQLRLGAVKIIIDRTRGGLNPPQEELNQKVFEIHRAGFQVALHAVEEAEIDAACTAIEYALLKSPRADHRHRIEHCSVCPPELAKRLASLNAIVVTHPAFVYYNGERYLKTVSEEQLGYLYPIASLINTGVEVAAGSDFPVVPPDPLVGIYGAVSRRTDVGSVLLPTERISLLDAFHIYTSGGACASFTEAILGSLIPDKLADLVVLSDDPFSLAPEEIKNLEVRMTVIGGEIVWRHGL